MKFDMMKVPTFSEDIFVFEKEDKYLFLNQELPNWIVLDSNAAYIAGKINGKKSYVDIIGNLKEDGATYNLDSYINYSQGLRSMELLKVTQGIRANEILKIF
jgi:hypothetical protein